MKALKKQKENHSVLSNMLYFLRLLFSISPLLVIGELLWGVLLIVPQNLISVLGLKYIIDVVEDGENLKRIFYAVAVIAAVLILSRLISWLFREFFWNAEKERVYRGLNEKLYAKARSLDLENYDNPDFYNNFILTIETSSDNIQNLLGLVRSYFGNIVSFLTISSVLLSIDPVCLVIILASVAMFIPLGRKIGSLMMERREENNKYHRRSDYFQRIFYLQDYAKEVRMNNIHPLLIKRYNEAADDVIATAKKYQTKIAALRFLEDSGVQVLGFMLALPLYLGYCVLIRHSLSAGDFVATFNSAYSIAMSINFLTIWAVTQFSERGKMIEKYRGFLACEAKIKDGEKTAAAAGAQEIEIKNLSFRYPESSEYALKKINLTIKPGEKIALVGYNGAGKTTLTNLLLRLYEPTSGEILIGGENINRLTLSSHRRRFAAAFQDFQIFASTIGENVALDENPDNARVLDALSKSSFSKQLENGADTELTREFDDGGILLSGGEAQKVVISRAFYKDCPYVILDEPSANLDPIAEYRLNEAMRSAAQNKTVIFISHRLSTTVNADRIYVMENGEIIESGTHSELIRLGGAYAYMFRVQSEKYSAGMDMK